MSGFVGGGRELRFAATLTLLALGATVVAAAPPAPVAEIKFSGTKNNPWGIEQEIYGSGTFKVLDTAWEYQQIGWWCAPSAGGQVAGGACVVGFLQGSTTEGYWHGGSGNFERDVEHDFAAEITVKRTNFLGGILERRTFTTGVRKVTPTKEGQME